MDTFPISDNNHSDAPSNHEFDVQVDDDKLGMSNDDRLAKKIVEESITRVNHFKFQIAVLFRHIQPNMPDNYNQAAI